MKKIGNLLLSYNSALIVMNALMLGIMGYLYAGFFSVFNLEVLAMGFITEAFMALGMTLAIIIGGIDLSIASILPFTAILVGMQLNWFTSKGFPISLTIAIAVVVTLLAAMGVGLLNATLINKLRVHPFIITLSMMLTLRGVNLVITDGGTVSGLPRAFGWLGQGYILGIPVPVALFAIVGPVLGYILANHRYVQQAYFIGGNLRSAQISGIDVPKFRVFVFMLSAALAGVAGIITASQYGAANMAYGQNAELRVIASVVIGGTNLLGGSGTIAGTALGVLFLATVYNAFTWTGINTYWQEVIIGSMLLIAVFIGQFVRGRQR